MVNWRYEEFVEGKNEIGAGGYDPGLQGCPSYIKYWSADEVSLSTPD